MKIDGLENLLEIAKKKGFYVKKHSRCIEIISEPNNIDYEEITIQRHRNVSYSALFYHSFLDTFLIREREYSVYFDVPFLKDLRNRAERMVNGEEAAEMTLKNGERAMAFINETRQCNDAEILKIVDFFIKVSEYKKKKNDVSYKKLCDVNEAV